MLNILADHEWRCNPYMQHVNWTYFAATHSGFMFDVFGDEDLCATPSSTLVAQAALSVATKIMKRAAVTSAVDRNTLDHLLKTMNNPVVHGFVLEAAVMASIEWNGFHPNFIDCLPQLFPGMELQYESPLTEYEKVAVSRFANTESLQLQRIAAPR